MVVVLYAILASTFVFAKKAVTYAQPCFLIGFRMVAAGAILLLYEKLAHNRSFFSLLRKDAILIFKIAFFHIYCAFVLEFWSLQFVSALKTTLIYSLTPFIAALLSYFLLNERLTKQKVAGICVGILGLLPLVAPDFIWTTITFAPSISLPDVALLASVVSSSYAWFLVKDLMNKGYSLPSINGGAMLIGGCLSFITSLFVEGLQQPVYDWQQFLLWVALLIIVANIIVYNLYGYLLRTYSITFLTFCGFLCPSFGALYEWLFMRGSITWHHAASLVLVTVGLYIFYAQDLKLAVQNPVL